MSTGGDSVCKVMRKVGECQTQLKLRDKNGCGNVRMALARKRKQLVKAEGESMARRSHAQVKLLTEEISKLMELKEHIWS